MTTIIPRCYSQSNVANIFSCGYAANSNKIDLTTSLKEKSFVGNDYLENLVDKIVALIGLSRNFIIVSYPEIRNVFAVTNNDGIRYIVYDPNLINEINNYTTKWSTLSILAHEIGHHLAGHTVAISKTLVEQRAKEIEADAFSGFIMYKLGASLPQALDAINLIASNNDDTYSTHPSLDKRKQSIIGGYEKARSQSSFYKIDPNKSAEEYYNEASALVLSKQYIDAVKVLNKVIILNPNYFKAYHDLGYCNQSLNDYSNAILNYNKSIIINPNFDLSYNNRGALKEVLTDYKGAIEDYNEALRINPNNAITYNNRGFTKNKIGDCEGSLYDISQAIKLQPNYANAYLNRSVTYGMQKKFKQAISDCDQAIKLNPGLAQAYYNRGSIKGQLKNISEMCNDLKIACNLGLVNACNAYNHYCH